ncbi:MAG: PhzF family phenazine biosynthesis protein [Dehalococcoidia bacterium]|nr:PhzF family phenazine biosynthesis protein [Dehalococcoidia bacterium]
MGITGIVTNVEIDTLPIYQVDAFTTVLFSGNPAAVCVLTNPLSDTTMQAIASENNLSETAFINISIDPFFIRWFTPVMEVNLCGHATLAAARILFDDYLSPTTHEISFDSRSGILIAIKRDDLIFLDFPVDIPTKINPIPTIQNGLGVNPISTLRGKEDLVAVFENESIIASIVPDYSILSNLDSRGLIITAPGTTSDFVSRFFAPQTGINEDAVTGSAHTVLTPYWSNILDKQTLTGRQLSDRGGTLYCELVGGRVLIGGATRRYMKGSITIPR